MWFWRAVYVTLRSLCYLKYSLSLCRHFSDPRCERKISLPHDQAGGASYGEERVSDNGTKRGVHKNLPAVIFLTPLTVFFFQRWKCHICVICGWIPTNAGQWGISPWQEFVWCCDWISSVRSGLVGRLLTSHRDIEMEVRKQFSGEKL